MIESFSTFAGVQRVLRRITTRLQNVESRVGSGSGGAREVFSGTGSPVGVVTANGPAVYLDMTNPSLPTVWLKGSAGNNNTDWQISATGAPIGYNEVAAAALGCRATIPGIEFPAPTSRASGRLVVTGVVDLNPGTGPLTMWWRGRLPSSFASPLGVCGIGPEANTLLGGSGAVALALAVINGDLNVVLGNSTTRTTYALGASSLANQVVDVHVTRSGSTLTLYLNGAVVASSPVNEGAGFTPDVEINALWHHVGAPLSATISNANNVVAGPCHRFVIYNRALSAADVLAAIRDGVDVADQWGVSTELMNATTLNGSFTDAGSGGADVFALWAEGTGTGTSTIVRDTTVFNSSTASLKFELDSVQSFRSVTQNILAIGKRYRVTCAFRHDRASVDMYPYITGFSAGYIPAGAWSPANVGANIWREFTAEFVATSTQFGIARFPASPAAAHNQWYDDIRLVRVGAIVDLQFDGTCGAQAADRANQRDATLFNGAAFTLPDSTRGFARWVAQVPGGEAVGSTAAIVIPTDCSISEIIVRNINLGTGQTFSMGSASGSPNNVNIVNAAPLNGSGTITRILPSSSTSSTGQLWISFSGTGSIEVTILFNRF